MDNDWKNASLSMFDLNLSITHFCTALTIYTDSVIIITDRADARAFFEMYGKPWWPSDTSNVNWNQVIRDNPDKGGIAVLLDVSLFGEDRRWATYHASYLSTFDCRSLALWDPFICTDRVDLLHSPRDHKV